MNPKDPPVALQRTRFATFAYISWRMYDEDTSTRFKALITG